jgi:cell division GTPase FtsZ
MEAKNILISITGSSNLTLKEVGDAMDLIQSRIASPSKVLGVAIDQALEDEVNITLLATGIGGKLRPEPEHPKKPAGKNIGEIPFDTGGKKDVDDTPAVLRGKGDNL